MQSIILTGSNLGNRTKQMGNVLEAISALAGSILKVSSLYESEPWGFRYPVPFLNQALLMETSFTPTVLLKKLLQIEQQMGRTRNGKGYAARTMDIDILFYGQEIIRNSRLTIPHPRLHLRRFVLVPATEICPGWQHPVLKQTLQQLLDSCTDELEVMLFDKTKTS
ncbi:MAG: 2-amino-4-hydroxy-6-hydroxymethyldihydropteridine diphosphokinase [Chlorobi bacterium]|nr:2-amino-4-hydroxy-6-hydroxymethyldihydropteridine diphosphokinase [Chlorobiota bacterium]